MDCPRRKATTSAKCFRGLRFFRALRGSDALVALLQHLLLDFFDEEGQVGAGEAQVGGGDAMVLNVGRHVLMVGMSGGKGQVIGVRLRVVSV